MTTPPDRPSPSFPFPKQCLPSPCPTSCVALARRPSWQPRSFSTGPIRRKRNLNVAIGCHGPVLAVTAFKFAQAPKALAAHPPCRSTSLRGRFGWYLERMLRFGASPCVGYRVATKLVGGHTRFSDITELQSRSAHFASLSPTDPHRLGCQQHACRNLL